MDPFFQVWQDFRQSFRRLLKNPVTSVAAVLALALGIGLTTAQYGLIYSLILKDLPFQDGDALIHLETQNLARDQLSLEVTQHDFLDWSAQQTSFEGLTAFTNRTMNLSGDQRPERVVGALMSPNFLEMLRMKPELGRAFREEDALSGALPVALLGHNVWQVRYAGDSDIVGKTIRVNGTPTSVIGVMPRDFHFPMRQEIWLPLSLDVSDLQRGDGPTLEVFGRLGKGVSLERAQSEMLGISSRLASQFPETNEGITSILKPYKREFVGDTTVGLLWTLLGAVGLVLLVACANVASLLLARASTRTKELAIRSVLGASRRRAIFQLLVDGLWIALAGGAASIGISWLCLRWLDATVQRLNPPFWFTLELDPGVLAFVAGASLVSALMTGLMPALQATRQDLNGVLSDASRGSTSLRLGRLSRSLVVAEIALSCGLLIAAGLTIRTVVNLSHLNFTFAPQEIVTARLQLSAANYDDDDKERDFYQRLRSTLSRRPEVETAALGTSLPTAFALRTRMEVEGTAYPKPQDRPRAKYLEVSPEYFEIFGIQAQHGRILRQSDRQEALPVAVVTQSFARRHWPEEEAQGRRIRLEEGDVSPWRTIVGVVPDQHLDRLQTDDLAAVFLPVDQSPRRGLTVILRGRNGIGDLVPALRAEVAALDADEPIFDVYSMVEIIDLNTFQNKILGSMFGTFALAALLLAVIGLYSVMAFAVGQRRQEIGVRMAFGARRGQILGLILRQGMGQTLIGLVLGIGLALLLGRGLQAALYQVRPTDPVAFAVPTIALALVALIACFFPARSAAALDPIKALHHD